MIYLATPYSHPDPDIRENRYLVVTRVAAELMNNGYHIYSPITHSHPIALAGELPTSWEFWEQYDRTMLSVCTEMIVLRLVGWNQSVGIKAEISLAESMGLIISYMDP